jgi:uncharacterized paraquat-inducible protein A
MADINFDWRFCELCFALFWNRTQGSCPARKGQTHQSAGFEFIVQDTPGPRQQPDWRHCSKCSVLYYNGFDSNGSCSADNAPGAAHPIDDLGPTGLGHIPDGTNFQVWHDVDLNSAGVQAQNNWRFCHKCFVLHFAGFEQQGECPTGGAHDHSGSFDYLLEH